MIANPADNTALDVETEWRNLQNALADLQALGLVEVTRLRQATLAALQRQLRSDEYHIFHFVGHGGFDQVRGHGMLLLTDEQGASQPCSGQQLGALLRDHQSLRLVLLNACEGARTLRNDPFAGVAQHLVQQEIPAVMAMQFEITDRAAITLTHEFYTTLAGGYPVDAALAEARKAIFAAGNDVEWGTPVLYLRAEDGKIFDIPAPVSSVEQAQPKSRQWRWPVLLLGALLLVAVASGALYGGFFNRSNGGDEAPTPTLMTSGSPAPEAQTAVITATPVVGPTSTYTPLPTTLTSKSLATATPTELSPTEPLTPTVMPTFIPTTTPQPAATMIPTHVPIDRCEAIIKSSGGHIGVQLLHIQPTSTSTIINKTVVDGTRVTILEKSVDGFWYYIQVDNSTGWVSSEYLSDVDPCSQ